MKHLSIVVLLFCSFHSFSQNVGIGTNTPHPSAKLEVSSNNSGFLPPRMTSIQRDSINNPAAGLQIFNTSSNCLQMFVLGKWQNVFCGTIDTTLLTDIDGHSYPTVKICNQTWTAKNLDVSRYRNGDIIPQVTDSTQWANLTTGAWCWYNNDSATYGSVYGRLYNWYAVNDPRGLAPLGWHVSSNSDWNSMIKCLDNSADTTCYECIQSTLMGGKLKDTGTRYWIAPNIGATNSSQFTALPGGFRNINTLLFTVIGEYGEFWTSTPVDQSYAWPRVIHNSTTNISKNTRLKGNGFSVRLLKD